MKRLLAFLLFLTPVLFCSGNNPDSIPAFTTIHGQIRDIASMNWVPFHWVYFEVDNGPGPDYHDSTFTIFNGTYQKVFLVNPLSQLTIKVSTFDCNHVLLDSVIHNYHPQSTVDFNICVPPPPCHAAFFFFADTLDPLKYYFISTSSGLIDQYHWDFGDNSSSVDENPVHYYTSPGTYTVVLKVSNSSPIDSCFDADTQTIIIPSMPLYNIGGQVFSGFFPDTMSQLILYKQVPPYYMPSDTAELNANGAYYFYGVLAGDYIIRATPLSGTNMPTYYNNVLLWHEPPPLQITEDRFDLDIHLLTPGQYPSGASAISGNILLMMNGSTFPGEGTEVILYNASMQALGYRYTDNNANFLFSGLDYGTYYLQPEITGIYIQAVQFDLSEINPPPIQISINLEANVGITESTAITQVSELFPNPGTTASQIEMNMLQADELDVAVLDLFGQVLQSKHYHIARGGNTLIIDYQSLAEGVYVARLNFQKSGMLCRKFLKINE